MGGRSGRSGRSGRPPRATSALTPRQERFVVEFLKDANATQAAIRAGYAPRSAEGTASRMLRNAKVSAAVGEAGALAFSNIQDLFDDDGHLLPIKDWPPHIAAAVSSIEVTKRNLVAGDGKQEDVLKRSGSGTSRRTSNYS